MNKAILAFTSALLLGGSAFGQLSINEDENKKVESIKVEGPSDNGDIKRAKTDNLKFISGDLFNGRLVKVSDKGLVWNHPDATADITFKTNNLDVVSLGHVPVSLRREGVSDITLTNGDKLFGIIEEVLP